MSRSEREESWMSSTGVDSGDTGGFSRDDSSRAHPALHQKRRTVTIHFAEDDVAVRRALERLLGTLRDDFDGLLLDFHLYPDGQVLLDAVLQMNPAERLQSLYGTDFNMPNADGQEVITTLRGMRIPFQQMLLICFPKNPQQRNFAEEFQEQGGHFLEKPVFKADLTAALRTALRSLDLLSEGLR